ncbi:hypothetical protein OROMI_028793 [Orobanche minor]
MISSYLCIPASQGDTKPSLVDEQTLHAQQQSVINRLPGSVSGPMGYHSWLDQPKLNLLFKKKKEIITTNFFFLFQFCFDIEDIGKDHKTMDQNPSLWKRRSTEKLLAATERKGNTSLINEEESEMCELVGTALMTEGGSKDHSAKKHVRIAQEAIAEALSLRKDLDTALQQKAACEERLIHLDTALKERTHQLHFVRNEQEKRIHTAIMKTSEEYEKTKIELEKRLAEAGKRVARLDAKNARFKKSLLKKDKVAEELSRHRLQVEADVEALRLRLESTEKENTSLRYELRVLEKEIEFRLEERESDLRMADLAQKQNKESVEKIAKLESECRKLRSLVQKQFPVPAALTRMMNEVEGLEEKDQLENLRRKSNHSMIGPMDFRADVTCDAFTKKRVDFLPEQLQKMEEEETRLQHALNNEQGMQPFLMQENLSGLGSDEQGTPSHRQMGTSDMNLMDDFAEMEKLTYTPAVSGHISQTPEKNKSFNFKKFDTGDENDSSMQTKGDGKFLCNMSIPIQKILDLLEGINVISQDSGVEESLPGKDDIDKLLPCKRSATFMVRVFRCETAEFSAVFQHFVQTCNGLLSGEADIEQFVQSVASDLQWILNHCFSIQDSDKLNILIKEDTPYIQPNTGEEDKGSNITSGNKNASSSHRKVGLPSQTEQVECFRIQLQDSKDINGKSQSQVSTNIEYRTEEQKKMKQDIETQLVVTNLECSKPCEKILDLENDTENTNKSSNEPEETSNDLKTQLEVYTSKEVPDDGKQLQNDLEITSASEKLAECQEALRNLGKQLKALASPEDTALFDEVVPTPDDPVISTMSTPRREGNQRLSLADKMFAEDNNVQISASSRNKESTQNGLDNSDVSTNAAIESRSKFADPNQIGCDAEKNAVVSVAIIPRKGNGSRSFLKKLIWWQKRGKSKKTTFS